MKRQPPKVLRFGQLIAAASAVLLLVTACDAEPVVGVARMAPAGIVTGKFVRIGGPIGPGGKTPTVPLRGQITFTGRTTFSGRRDRTFKVRVSKKGTFTIALLVGTYQVIGRTPDITGEDSSGHVKDASCRLPHKIKVTRHHTVKIRVICAVP